MQPCMHDSEFGEHSRESLKMTNGTVLFHDKFKDALCFSVRDFQLDTRITRRFAVLTV